MPNESSEPRWKKIMPREWDALPENEKREIAREMLRDTFGPPENEQKERAIEEILNKLYAGN